MSLVYSERDLERIILRVPSFCNCSMLPINQTARAVSTNENSLIEASPWHHSYPESTFFIKYHAIDALPDVC